MKTLVTGATGNVGGEIVKALLKRGESVRALTRKQPDEGKLPEGTEVVLGDLSDPVSVAKAMEGVDKLFLLIGNVADELTQSLTAFGLAKRAGLEHVTYLSVFRADEFPDVPHFAAKHTTEQAIEKQSVVPYTILRPGYFIQNDARLQPLLTGPAIYPTPVGDKGVAVVDIRDIGEAAAISLTESGHENQSYDLVSSEALTGPWAAKVWSRLLNREIHYSGHGDLDAFEAQLRKAGNPNWLTYDLRMMFQGYVEHGFAATEVQVARFGKLLGHTPRTYSSVAADLATLWKAS